MEAVGALPTLHFAPGIKGFLLLLLFNSTPQLIIAGRSECDGGVVHSFT